MTGRPKVVVVDTEGPVRAAFTTRAGGVSRGPWAALNLAADGGDDPASVRANRERLAANLAIEPRAVTMVRQVHGADVLRVDTPTDPGLFTGALRGWRAADALVCRRAQVPLMVLGADCPPVLIWRRDGGAVGAAHAGWRGLVAGVVENAVAALGEPAALAAAIGPGIGPCCYRVSAEVVEVFRRRFGDAVVHGDRVDLAASARRALIAGGVPEGSITALATCTSCDGERWFSHRASGGTCGRHAGIIWATDEGVPHA